VDNGRDKLKRRPLLAGRYRIDRALDSGGMARVFLAYQEPFERPVAVKILRAEHVDDAILVKRFEQEARTISQLVHPNTVRVYDSGRTDQGHLFIVMEFVDGRSLEQELWDRGILTLDEAVTYTIQIAQALGEANHKGIVHRDLKPANVMVVQPEGTDPFVKVLDFGIAKILDSDRKWTDMGNIIGTPYYMAPEQAKQNEVDGRADIYSLACCLYEMLVGQPIFPGDSVMQVLMAHQQQQPPRLPDTYPAALDDFLQRSLSKEPGERPRDTATFIAQLMMSVVPGQESLSSRIRPNTPTDMSFDGIDPARHKKATLETPVPLRISNEMLTEMASTEFETPSPQRASSPPSALFETVEQTSSLPGTPEMTPVNDASKEEPALPTPQTEQEEPDEDPSLEVIKPEPRVVLEPTEEPSPKPTPMPQTAPRSLAVEKQTARSNRAIAFVGILLVICALAALAFAIKGQSTTTLEIKSDPAGSIVEIDGVDVGKTPLDYKLAPGRKVSVQIKRRGFVSKSYPAMEVFEDRSNSIFVELEPKLIDLEVSSPSDATVKINGEEYGAVSAGNARVFSVVWPNDRDLRVEVERDKDRPYLEVFPQPKLSPTMRVKVP
jgi:serine/threonine-protein kinase